LIAIAKVQKGSIAADAGIESGDRILTVNGCEVRDSIDFQFLAAEERISVIVKRKDGSERALRIKRGHDQPLGLTFRPFPVKRCRNNCIFCFVDQMPKGCRSSLMVKDDDFRASFLFGNYITLGNLCDEDWERIFTQRLSPLYISVHATEPRLRTLLLNNRSAPDIMEQMRRLAAGGIRMHAQIVLCPGINDGMHLMRTVEDLASLYPMVQSIAAVPVGLTRHRRGLYPLRIYRRREARQIVDVLTERGSRYRRTHGNRLVYPSDELYIRAGVPVPPANFYGEFPQIENGVGMVAEFLHQSQRIRMPSGLTARTLTAVTGVSFAPILHAAIKRFATAAVPSIRVVAVRNDFFGPTVTVAGLLTGRDILRTLRGKRIGSMLLIPASALKDDERIFLDGMHLQELATMLDVQVLPVKNLGAVGRLLKTIAGKRGIQ
jgi:putative radical SAM enzyme (TIGR03279 family)